MHGSLMGKNLRGEGETSDKEMPRDLTDLDVRLPAVRTLLLSRSKLGLLGDQLQFISPQGIGPILAAVGSYC